MGICSSKNNKKLTDLNASSKRCRSNPKSLLSLQIPNNEDNEIEAQQDKKKIPGSVLQEIPQSLLIRLLTPMLKTPADTQTVKIILTQMWLARIQQQPILMLPVQIQSEQSQDSFHVPDSSVKIQEIFSLAKNSNYLKQIATSCIFLNFRNNTGEDEIQIDFDSEDNQKISMIPLENQSIIISNDSPINCSNIQKARQQYPKKEKQQKSLSLPQNTFFLQQFNTQKNIHKIISQSMMKKFQKEMINHLCSEVQKTVNYSQVQRKVIETLSALMEQMSLNVINHYTVIWILRRIFSEERVELVLNFKDLPKSLNCSRQSQMEYRVQDVAIFDFKYISLLNSNIAKFYFEISFKEDQQYNFRQIFGCTLQKKQFLEQLEKQIQFALASNNEKQFIYWVKALLQNNELIICFSVPYLLQSHIQKFLRSFQEKLSQKYNLKQIKVKDLVSCINISLNIFDAWGNREFKTYIAEQDEKNYFSYIRPVGWKQSFKFIIIFRRFGLKIDESPIRPNKRDKYVNGYMKLTFLTGDIFQKLQIALDIGPNSDAFEQKNCGAGVIICQNVANLLPTTQESQIPMDCRLKPVELRIQNETFYYYVVVQVKIKQKLIRIPENFGIQLFIVNNYIKVLNEGILLKELNKMEYQESMKLLGLN